MSCEECKGDEGWNELYQVKMEGAAWVRYRYANVEREFLALIISIDPHADRSFLQTIGLAMFANCTRLSQSLTKIESKAPLIIVLRRNIVGNFREDKLVTDSIASLPLNGWRYGFDTHPPHFPIAHTN